MPARRWTRSRARSTRATGSIWDPAFPFPKDGYPGDYLLPIADAHSRARRRALARRREAEWLTYFATFGRDANVARTSKPSPRASARRSISGRAKRRCTTRGAIATGIERLRRIRTDLRERRRAVAAHDADRRQRGPRGRALRRPPGLFRQRRRLSLREAAARRPRDRHPRSRSSRLHPAPARAGRRLRPQRCDRGADLAADHAQARRRDRLDVQARTATS